jgi:isopenicillin N synthase-like dioxygenase
VHGPSAGLPPFPATEEENTGFSEHEDGNCITFIFQDGIGGLEVLKGGHWVAAVPVDGSVIVNTGDVIQVLQDYLTGDELFDIILILY